MKILVIEDEMYDYRLLRNLLEKAEPEAEVIGPIASVEQAKSFLQYCHYGIDIIIADIQLEDGETAKSDSYLKKLADRGASKLLEQLRTGSIEMTLDADGLEPGDVCFCSLPDLGYKATVRVADVITQSQSDSTTRTVRLGTPVWRKL